MYCGYIHYDLLSSTVAIPVVAVRERPTRGVSCRGQQRIALGLGERQLSVQRAHLCLDRCTTGQVYTQELLSRRTQSAYLLRLAL